MPLLSTPDVCIESEETAWSGRFGIDVIRFRNRRFDGSMSAVRTWELFRRGRAAAVLPYDPWTDQVLLIEQFRLPAFAAGVQPVMTEIPAGLCDDGEDPAATARREAAEETGVTPDLLTPIGDIILTPGGSDERCIMFAGRIRAPASDAAGIVGMAGLAAEQEDIRARLLPAAAAIDAALAGHYANSVTMLALLWLAAKRSQLRADWCT